MQANPGYTDKFPGQLPTSITLKLKTGKILTKEIPVAPWDADCQPSDKELYNKMVLQGDEQANEVWDSIFKN